MVHGMVQCYAAMLWCNGMMQCYGAVLWCNVMVDYYGVMVCMVQCHGGIPTCSSKMAELMTLVTSCYVLRCIITCQYSHHVPVARL
jgi:hypothetical protein